MNVLFLDDEQWRHDAACKWNQDNDDTIWHVSQSSMAIKLLRGDYFDIVFLDHDLVVDFDPEQSGMDVVEFLIDESKKPESDVWMPGLVVVHSWNYYAALIMVDKLKSVGIQVVRWFFDPTQNAVNLFREKANEARAKRVRLAGSNLDGRKNQ